MSDILHQRSDLLPGQYTCLECNKNIQLMEAWRKTVPQEASSLASLFCQECGQKLASIGLDVGPLQLTMADKLNIQI